MDEEQSNNFTRVFCETQRSGPMIFQAGVPLSIFPVINLLPVYSRRLLEYGSKGASLCVGSPTVVMDL